MESGTPHPRKLKVAVVKASFLGNGNWLASRFFNETYEEQELRAMQGVLAALKRLDNATKRKERHEAYVQEQVDNGDIKYL
jgi:hypothetical protein